MRKTALYILFLALFLEGSSRLFWRLLDRTWGFVVPPSVGRFDPELGWSPRPGSRDWSKATGVRVEYAVNALGLRGPETTARKPEGTFRLAVLGDSHAFGFGVPEESTWARVLQGYFTATEVLNLGVCGYGVDQMLLRLERDGFPLEPDLVVCYVPHYADFRHMTDKSWGQGNPRLVEEDGALKAVNVPVANNPPWLQAAMGADRALSSWSRTYGIVRDTVHRLSVTQARPGEPPPAVDPAFLAETNRMGARIVLEMQRRCSVRGVGFVLATRVGELAMEASAQGVPVLFLAAPLLNDGLYLANDPGRHPDEAAGGIIAWETASFLMENRLVPESRWRIPPPLLSARAAAPGP